MPMFEFACRACGHQFETLVMGGRSQPRCPQCESDDLEKQYSVFGTGAGSSRGGSVSLPMGGG